MVSLFEDGNIKSKWHSMGYEVKELTLNNEISGQAMYCELRGKGEMNFVH